MRKWIDIINEACAVEEAKVEEALAEIDEAVVEEEEVEEGMTPETWEAVQRFQNRTGHMNDALRKTTAKGQAEEINDKLRSMRTGPSRIR